MSRDKPELYAMYILNKELFFPPAKYADEDGLIAIGGDLSTERLLLAYRNGIFPWYNEDEPVCWYCPDPRFVLLTTQLKISKSMKTVINTGIFSFTTNRAFTDVIKNCRTISRKNQQESSWISDAMIEAYTRLHTLGFATSAEAWQNGELVGGLYGIQMGKVFFGESMFSKKSNASKFAFIKYVQFLQASGVELIDCQVYTNHLESLGASMINRDDFLKLLTTLLK